MRRSLLWILTVFLSLAMIALVGVQTYWIKHAIDTKEQQFGFTVNQVLGDISGEMARNETMMAILDEIRPPVMNHTSKALWDFRMDGRTLTKDPSQQAPPQEPEKEAAPRLKSGTRSELNIAPDTGIRDLSISGEFDFESGEGEIRIGTGKKEDIYPILPTEPRKETVYQPPHQSIKNQSIQIIDDTILVVLGEDEHMHDTILVTAMHPDQIRDQLIRTWKDQEAFVDRIVRQMMEENSSIRDRFTAAQFETMLNRKLMEKGVDIPFEYAVYEEGKAPIYQSGDFNEYEPYRYYRAPLVHSSIYNRPTLISVYFPQEKRQLIKSMGIMGGTSALITLFVLTLFSLALYIIFKQRKLSEMKNDFVNNMTHELKTPISTISLASQMLSDRSIPDQQKNLSQISRIIQTESKQLGFQVERVLQMAIFDHGQLKLKTEPLDLHELIETVAQNFLLQLDRRNGKLEFLPEAESTTVLGDNMHLTNVISNLLENAVKYSRQAPRICITTLNERANLVISVSDNGIGISKENQKKIFDKFYRVPTGNVHNVKGFGLGLSYVKLIVEEHGGTIRLKSEPGKGSKFDIVLPLYKESSS